MSPGVPGWGGGVKISVRNLLAGHQFVGILEGFLSGLIVGVRRNGQRSGKFALKGLDPLRFRTVVKERKHIAGNCQIHEEHHVLQKLGSDL